MKLFILITGLLLPFIDSYESYPSDFPEPTVFPEPTNLEEYGSYITGEASMVYPGGTPCVLTLTKTYTEVVTYDQCRPSDYEPPSYIDSGCTTYHDKEYCGGYCFVYADWIDQTALEYKTHCDTSGCKFVTNDGEPHFDCAETKTLSNGCYEVYNQQYDYIMIETICPSTLNPLPTGSISESCSLVTLQYDESTYTLTSCLESMVAHPPSGCEFTLNSIFSRKYLTCRDQCTKVGASSLNSNSQIIMSPCTAPTGVPTGCMEKESTTYCPPQRFCTKYETSSYYSSGNYYLYGLTESLCRTNECSFTTIGSGIIINCAPYTSTLYNGCFIVEETTSGKVTTSTICETDSTALPTYLSNCTMGTYFPSHTNDEDFTGYTVCPYNVVLPEGCKTTDWPYFYSEIAVTCNPPCTSTFTSGSSTYTTFVDPCPTYEDPLITVFPTTTDYDGSCALYNGNMTCPDHCVLTSSDEYYGDTMYVKASYSCDPRLSCLFVGYWGPTPSFSCITYSTESISGLEDCFTSLIYPSYTSDYSTIFTLCPWHVSIPIGCHTTSWPYCSAQVIETCNPPCTSTYSSGSNIITTTLNPCPTTSDPSQPPFESIRYPTDCVSYNSSMTCPDHCGEGWNFEGTGETIYMYRTFYCDSDTTCLFKSEEATPTFSCSSKTTPAPPFGIDGCSTKMYTLGSEDRIITICDYEVSIPEGCQTTNSPYVSGYRVIETCNPPCTSVYSSYTDISTITFDPCPTNPPSSPTDDIRYPTDCVSYMSTMTCPDHCGLGWNYEGNSDGIQLYKTYFCNLGTACLFITGEGSPSFSCSTVSTSDYSPIYSCTSPYYPSSTSS